jgi:L-seryl-tRNA(Ser) seleniumtransferase
MYRANVRRNLYARTVDSCLRLAERRASCLGDSAVLKCPQEASREEDRSVKNTLSTEQAELLRQLPSVDELLAQPRLVALAERTDRALVLEIARAALAELRAHILDAPISDATTSAGGRQVNFAALTPHALEQRIADEVSRILARSLQPVINATGVILHTNLGRAPLPAAVVEEFRRTATQYSNLEYDLAAGARGKRDVHTAHLLERLTGAEAAIVVNNCAAAVLLVLAALAKTGEVLVSRGELIEIGDGFRIPEIMAESGAVLREVGATNRTHLSDYEKAISGDTKLLLRVHPSNFKMVGFTEKPALAELVALSRRAGIPLVEDLGSGCLVDLSAHGVSEPTVRESIDAGVDIVMFSGDKLLGGPQAGIIAGKKELIARVRRHPLFRALRVDKLTIAALETTLGAYLRAAWDELPALRMMRLSVEKLQRRSEEVLAALRPQLPRDEVECEIVEGHSLAGGGSTPSQTLPTKLLRFASVRHSAAQLEQRLRRAPAGISVIARVEDDRLVIDLRTVFPEQEPQLIKTLAAALH